MNINLFALSLIFILVGIGIGFYFLALFGLILMIPSLLSSSRPAAKSGPSPQSPQEQPRRISHQPVVQQPPAALSQAKTETMMPMPPTSPMASSVSTYSPALFPSPILPTLSPIMAVSPAAKETGQHKEGERDELVEVGAVLALLKLALG